LPQAGDERAPLALQIVGRLCQTPGVLSCVLPYSQVAPTAFFTIGLGQRPRIHEIQDAAALRARFTFGTSWIIIGAHAAIAQQGYRSHRL